MGNNRLFSLQGKRALITGGSRGLGLAIAGGLAGNGAEVTIIARDKNQLERAAERIENCGNGPVSIFSCDLHDIEAIDATFHAILKTVGPIDILVNSAGINLRGPAEDIEFEAWNEVIQINLSAVFRLSQVFCNHRKSVGGGGKIINIGSLMCRASRPTTAPYTASKSGLLGLTKALAVEWAEYKINVNAIGPGYFLTDMTQNLKDDEKFNEWVISNTPLARWGKPEDLVGSVVFLSSSASEFITGQIIYIDGGWFAGV